MESIRKASAFLFYLLGGAFILLVILAKRGGLPDGAHAMVHALDLPLLFIAILFGGSSLYVSLTKGGKSLPLLLAVAVPLGVLFAVFAWVNFSMPFAEF